MKAFLFSTLIFAFAFSANAQKPLRYENVIEAEGTAQTLYGYFVRFQHFTGYFKELVDAVEGDKLAYRTEAAFAPTWTILSGNAAPAHGSITFDIDLYFKDGRFKYVLSNFQHVTESGRYSFGVLTDSAEFPEIAGAQSKKWKQKVWEDLTADAAAINVLTETEVKTFMQNPKVVDADEKQGW